MPSTNLYRSTGLALLFGAVLGIVGNVLSSVLFPGNDPRQFQTSLFVIVTLVGLIGQMFLLMGLPGMAARQAPYAGPLGLVGFALTFLGGLLFTSFSVIGLVIFPWLAQAAPNLLAGNGPPPTVFVFFLIASILFGLGGLLLGIAVMRGGVLPRSAGLLLLVGAVLNAAAFPLNGLLSTVVSTVAFILFAAGLGWIGYALASEGRVAARVT